MRSGNVVFALRVKDFPTFVNPSIEISSTSFSVIVSFQVSFSSEFDKELDFRLKASTRYFSSLSFLNLYVFPPSCTTIPLRAHFILAISSELSLNFIFVTLMVISSLGLILDALLVGQMDMTLFKAHFPLSFSCIFLPEGVVYSTKIVYIVPLFSGTKVMLSPFCENSFSILPLSSNIVIFKEESSSSVGSI